MDPALEESTQWTHKEIQNLKKQAKYTILWLFLSVIAKMKVKGCVGAYPDPVPSSDFKWFEL